MAKSKENKKQHGGARPGAGRPKADREDTKIISFRLPVSQIEALEAVAGHHDVTVHALCRSLVVAALNNGNIAERCYREAARGDAHIRPSDDPALQGKLEKLWEELHDEQRRGVISLCTKK